MFLLLGRVKRKNCAAAFYAIPGFISFGDTCNLKRLLHLIWIKSSQKSIILNTFIFVMDKEIWDYWCYTLMFLFTAKWFCEWNLIGSVSTITSARACPFRLLYNVLGYSFSVWAICHVRVIGTITLTLENWWTYPIVATIQQYHPLSFTHHSHSNLKSFQK